MSVASPANFSLRRASPTGPATRPAARGVATRAAYVVALGLCLTPWAGPPVALAGGVVMSLLLGNPFGRAGQRASKYLLQVSVVLLGFGMDLPVVLRAGASGALLAAGTIGATLALGHVLARWLGVAAKPLARWLGVAAKPGALFAAGTAICGGSAVAAVGSATDADQKDITIAMGTVFVLNAAALYLFPAIGHALGLSQVQFGTWAGVAIHDVSSVVGAAGNYGPEALRTATAVKLSRALWIVPLVIVMAWRCGRPARVAVENSAFGFDVPRPDVPRSSPTRPPRVRRVQVPYFIGLFLLASVARSFAPGVAQAAPMLTHAATAGLTATLFLIGAGITRETLAAVGWPPLLQGLLLWAFISMTSLAAILAYA